MHALCMDAWDWALSRVEPKYKVAIDAGANDGGYTHMMREKGFQVHAFEPVPDMYEILANRFKDDPMVFCNPQGLTDYPCTLKGVTIKANWTLAEPQNPLFLDNKKYKDHCFDVELTTIDEYMGQTYLGFLKLDVDGYEHKVLAGAPYTLKLHFPAILCEFSLYVEGISHGAAPFIEFILQLGYVIVPMDGTRIFDDLPEILKWYPHRSSFDVMLMPRDMADACLRELK